jgi:hypothetical protein
MPHFIGSQPGGPYTVVAPPSVLYAFTLCWPSLALNPGVALVAVSLREVPLNSRRNDISLSLGKVGQAGGCGRRVWQDQNMKVMPKWSIKNL